MCNDICSGGDAEKGKIPAEPCHDNDQVCRVDHKQDDTLPATEFLMNDGRYKGNERNKNSYREVQIDILRGDRKIAAVDKGAKHLILKWWASGDSSPGLFGYEPDALTN